ncbi:MAG TPA: hypothetical protein VG796_16135 [Verrucomicrobiales bacterium]|nr:hypothetical protein [Verrucomicrobiales bacterium]
MNEPEDNDPAAVLLTRIRPAAPSAELMQRLLAARPAVTAAPVERPRLIRFLPRLATAAAVFAIAGAAVWHFREPAQQQVVHTPSPAPKPEVALRYLAPQESRQELLGVRDLGFTRDAQNRPVRLMHATWLDDNAYSQGDGAPPVREARVRDEILPVVLTTY